MEKLSIVETDSTPKILFDPENGVFEFTGCSITDEPVTYYEPIIAWIKRYASKATTPTRVVFKLTYFNTASAKALFDVLTAWATLKNISIVWYHSHGDEDIKQAGEEFFELVNIPFEFKTY